MVVGFVNWGTMLLLIIGDPEPISDHSVNLPESAEEIRSKGQVFSPKAAEELRACAPPWRRSSPSPQRRWHSTPGLHDYLNRVKTGETEFDSLYCEYQKAFALPDKKDGEV